MRYKTDRQVRKQKKANLFGDFGRVVGPRPLAQLGTFMMRKPAYVQMGVLSVLGYLSQRDMVQLKGVLLGGTASLFTRLFGAILKYGPSYLLKSSKTAADQAGFKYNVAQKRVAFMEHQDVLWDYVYGLEAATLYTEEEIAGQRGRLARLDGFLRKGTENYPRWVKRLLMCEGDGIEDIVVAQRTAFPVSPGIERTCGGFRDSFAHGLQRDYDREQQNRVLGFDVNCIEDYLRAAILCEDDTFLREHWKSCPGLGRARKKTQLYYDCLTPKYLPTFAAWFETAHSFCKSVSTSVWHALTSSVLSTKLGKALRALRKRLQSFDDCDEADLANIDAQLVFWRGLERRPWVAKYPGLEETIHEIRQHILIQGFGTTRARAEVMLERLTRFYEMRAMELRRKFDYEYCDGSRTVNWFAGVEAFGDYQDQVGPIREVTEARSGQLVEFEGWLRSRGAVFAPYLERTQGEAMRYIADHPERFRAFLETERTGLVRAYDRERRALDRALLGFSDDKSLAESGVSNVLVEACHAYAQHVAEDSRDLFHKTNATRLRAAKVAFHANVKNMRAIYDRRAEFSKLSDAARKESIVATVGEVVAAHRDYTLQLREVRTHHALCRINTLIVGSLVLSLRDYDWKPVSNTFVRGCRRVVNAVGGMASRS